MIKVYYEEYYNDFIRRNKEKVFADLTELEEWMFGQMQQNYEKAMAFLTPAKCERICAKGPWEIEFTPTYGGPHIWIHQITIPNGIIFSDGKRTNGQRHWSKEVQEWLIHCEEKRSAPKFTFVA